MFLGRLLTSSPTPLLIETVLLKHIPLSEQSRIFHARMHYFTLWIHIWHIFQIHGRCCQNGQNNHPPVALVSYYEKQRLHLVIHTWRTAPHGHRGRSLQPHPGLLGCLLLCLLPISNLEFDFLSTRKIPNSSGGGSSRRSCQNIGVERKWNLIMAFILRCTKYSYLAHRQLFNL